MSDWITDRPPTEADGDAPGQPEGWTTTAPTPQPGETWKYRNGLIGKVRANPYGSLIHPIASDRGRARGLVCHYPDGCSYTGNEAWDLVKRITDALAEPPPPSPVPATGIPESFRTGAEPFYVLVVSDDITCGGGQPIVWEHPVPSKTTLQAVLQHQRRLGNQYGTTFIAECRIIPELTNDA